CSFYVYFICLLVYFVASALQIIKGRKAEKKQMMYMASVQDNNGHICGGFLVSEYFVMTAAHCAPNVVLGTHNLKKVDDTMRYDVKMCKHSFKDVLSGNDIMLLKFLSKNDNYG
uniref:Peptidase S1 domain-containing protein n=1 Tax=Maylandia zebra TaxID=106582 RepID=A0A3P9BSI7_9CICH